MEALQPRIAWIAHPVARYARQCRRQVDHSACWYPSVAHYLDVASPADGAAVVIAEDHQWPAQVRQLTTELWQRCLPAAPILWLKHTTPCQLHWGWRSGVVEVICGQLPLRVVQERVLWAARRWSPIGRTLWAMRELVVRQGRLTPRQRQFCELLIQGYGVKKIAARWGLSPHTVRNQRNRVLEKLGLQSEVELVHVWTTLQWLDRVGELLQRTLLWPHIEGRPHCGADV